MDQLFTSVWLKVAVLVLITSQLTTEALQITSSGPQTIQKPQGQTVSLGCTYTPGTEDTGELDIEWSNVSPDMTQKDKLIVSYSGGQMHFYESSYSKRMAFLADPKQGDASISISGVKISDTGTYQCKVKKSPGVDMRKITLVVMVPPSKPKCWVEGREEKGGSVSLRCKSSMGSIPLTYRWTRESGGTMPATATQDPTSGELLIKNHTDSNTGTYMCEAKNSVGQEMCKYSLRAYNPINKAGVIAGAVIGALLLLLLLLLLIWCLVSHFKKKRYQKEVANEIRHDAPAPESRPTSRASSIRSMVGYRTHHGIQYNAVASPMPSISESGLIFTGGNNETSSAGTKAASFRYDPQYGYAV
ncbi:V-set and immunoglobulin domain-containing protein 8b [Kryptolebias marmoratus]|uniref:V-set and immunoglobulin domain containing 8b n=1 Tax=Kryptolebias marmoratus TaxID=37003 RepID=A0A3Q3AJ01_KRYMA|nr:V-set and immunoglobulin domain-containing protein 8b [Kryptolebias marmoratus]